MKKSFVILAVLVTLVACDRQPETYGNPQQVVDAMADARIGCDNLVIDSGAAIGETDHDSLVDERAVCSVDGVPVAISTFDGREERDDWLAVGRLLGPVAVGPNWVATSESEKTVEEIADALHASRADEHERFNP